jgi:large subunit ribosomal protein L28
MFVPVLASGTGNTFSASIADLTWPSASAACRSQRRTMSPSTLLPLPQAPYRQGSSVEHGTVVRYPSTTGSAETGSMTNLTTTKWSDPVASVCDVCGKGPGFGNNVSHSHRRTPRRWNPNIQRVRAMVGKTPRRLNVCTSCIKAGKVTR